MKRTALLLAILAVFSITSVSQVCALPVVGDKAVTVSNWLSYYFAYLMGGSSQNVLYENRAIGDNGSDVILRGDADDYANGKDIGGGTDPKDRGLDDQDVILRSTGSLSTGSSELKIKY